MLAFHCVSPLHSFKPGAFIEFGGPSLPRLAGWTNLLSLPPGAGIVTALFGVYSSLALCLGAEDLNSGLDAYKASTSPTVPPLQPLYVVFLPFLKIC